MRRHAARAMVVAGIAAAVLALSPAPPAAAHPLGNFTVNLYSGIVVAPHEVRLHYVLDMAEIPTFQEMRRIDLDGDGHADSDERAAWARATAPDLLDGIALTVDGRPVELTLGAAAMTLPEGQGGLDTLRLEVSATATAPLAGRIEYRDANYPSRIGWREITATGTDGAAVRGSSVPARSLSGELRRYPSDLLSSPLEVSEAAFSFSPGDSGSAISPTGAAVGAGPSGGAFVELVSRPELSLPIIVLSLLAALGIGALHALAPGHGKTLMAAYLVGAGARAKQAVGVGLAVSAMHTASVLGVGLLVIAAERAFPAERVYPWLGLLSGLVALALGAALLVTRARNREGHRHDHDEHDHSHEPPARPLSRRGLTAIAVSGGILPSPTALLVLLAAVALQRTAFGIALILAFSVGLAAALTTIGLLALRAGDAFARRFRGRLARALPIASAAVILTVGAVLTARAAGQL